MQGQRLPDAVFGEPGPGWDAYDNGHCALGSYMLVDYHGKPNLWLLDPAGHVGRVSTHTITEHEDGTITVSPSIYDAPDGWHGYLKRGVWRSV